MTLLKNAILFVLSVVLLATLLGVQISVPQLLILYTGTLLTLFVLEDDASDDGE